MLNINPFSVVIPVYNEANNINLLLKEIINVLNNKYIYEIIIVDDYSNDGTTEILNKIKNSNKIKTYFNKKRSGQSFSILAGIKNSSFNHIVTLDGDCQNDPNDIPRLLMNYFNNEDCFLVSGIRTNRKDSISKIFASKIANFVRSLILKDNCPDTGCSLKIFSKKIFLKFDQFDGIHRFLPAFFKKYGSKNIYIPVNHRYRKSGVSKYNNSKRLFKGIKDIIRVMKILNKTR